MADRKVNVNIETRADTSGLDKAKGAVDKLGQGSQEAEKKTTKLGQKLEGLGQKFPEGSRARGFFDSLSNGANGAALKIGAVTGALVALVGIVKQGIGRVAITEDLEASLTTLLGSADAAKQRMQEITEFAAETPASIAGLASVSRVLQTLSNGALGASESLRLVGDAAAVAQRPGESLDSTMQNVALHVGRLNAALRSGKGEIGESTLRLQELGLIGPEVAFRLRELHQEAGRGEEAWRLLEESLKSFDGEMERRSKTITGKTSTMADAWNGLTAAVAKPLAPLIKSSLSGATAVFNTLAGAVGRVARFIQLLPDDAKTAGDGVAAAAKKAKDAVIDLEAAATRGADGAKAAVESLIGRYDDLEDGIKRAITRGEELRKLNLDLTIQGIEADPSLTPVEKERRKGAAREAAGQESSQAVIDGLGEQMRILSEEVRMMNQKALDQSQKENDLVSRIADLQAKMDAAEGEKVLVARLSEVADKLRSEVSAADDLEKAIPEESNLNRRAMLKARLADMGDMSGKREQLGRLDEQIEGLDAEGPSQNLREAHAQAVEQLAEVKRLAKELRDAEEDVRKNNQRQVQALEEEVEHQKRKAKLQLQLERGNTRSAVTTETRREVEESRKEGREQISDRDAEGRETLGAMADTLESLAGLAGKAKNPRAKEEIESAAQLVEEGDLSRLQPIIDKALGSTNAEAKKMGQTLESQAGELRVTFARIVDMQRAGMGGMAQMAATIASLSDEMQKVLGSIANLREQVKNNRR